MNIQIQSTKTSLEIKKFMGNVEKAFSDQNYKLWLDCFDYKDDMSLSAEKDWFIGYVLNDHLSNIKIDWQAVRFSQKEEMYQMISDTLTILMTGGEYHA